MSNFCKLSASLRLSLSLDLRRLWILQIGITNLQVSSSTERLHTVSNNLLKGFLSEIKSQKYLKGSSAVLD